MTALSTALPFVVSLRSLARRATLGVAMGLGIAALTTAGCSKPALDENDEVRLKIGFGASADARDRSLRVLSRLLFAESLLSVGWDGRPIPGLVKSWEWQDGGKTLRLQLRDNLKFHNGRVVNAAVVAAILQRRVEEATSAEMAPYVGGFEHVERIDSPDDLTLHIRLSRPDTFLLSALDETLIMDGQEPDIGTGPFRIADREPNLIAEKNTDYHRGTPAIDTVEIIHYETQRSALAAMMRGEVDMVQEVARDSVEFLEGASRIATYASLRPYYIPLVFNLRHPILKRLEVRRAILQAIDKQQIVAEAMGGRGRIAEDPVWPLHWAYSDAAHKRTFNPEAARLQLDALGLPVRAPEAGAKQMASRFRITCLYWAEDSESERIALLLQRQLGAVGIDLALEPVNAQEMGERNKRGDFEVHLFRLLGGRSFDWTYRFWHSPVGNEAAMQDTGYSGADKLLEELRSANTDDETRAAVAELQRRFYEDAPAAFIAWIETTRAVDEAFDVGEKDDPDIFANLWRWKPVGRKDTEQ